MRRTTRPRDTTTTGAKVRPGASPHTDLTPGELLGFLKAEMEAGRLQYASDERKRRRARPG